MNNLESLQNQLRTILEKNTRLPLSERELLLESMELFNEEELEKLILINHPS